MSQWPLILPLRVFYFERSGFENRQMTNQHRVCSHFPKSASLTVNGKRNLQAQKWEESSKQKGEQSVRTV